MSTRAYRLSLRAFLIGALLSGVFAALTVYFSNRLGMEMTSCQIPVLPYIFLFLVILLINPIFRRLRVLRPLSSAEILTVFSMGIVSSGISIYGLSAQVVPIMANLFNPYWNNAQTEWNRYIEPLVNETFFVAEPGIHQASVPYRDALGELERMRTIHEAALALTKADDRVAETKRALDSARTNKAGAAEVRRAEMAASLARDPQVQALKQWQAMGNRIPAILDQAPREAVGLYARLIDRQEARVVARRDALRALESRAFKRVEEFRRGLPPQLRAFPGVFPMSPDTFRSYTARLRRFWYGTRALRDLHAAYRSPAEPPGTDARIAAALDCLRLLSKREEVQGEREAIQRRLEQLRQRLADCNASLEAVNAQSRIASPREKGGIERQIRRLASEHKRLERAQREESTRLGVAARETETADRIDAIIQDLTRLRSEIGPVPSDAAVRSGLAPVLRQFPAIDASLRRYFLGDIPWGVWVSPLLRWCALVALTYAVLMAINILIFRQWAHNEKLVYPLAQLPEELTGATHADAATGGPPLFRSAYFWIGAGISAVVLGWNLLCASQVVPGLQSFNLTNEWRPFIENSPLQGLLPSAKSTVFFTMIGLSFLIPQKITFSLWFFALLYMAQLLALVSMGYGVNEDSFPMDWWYTMNFRTAEGGGALLVFSALVLYKCRRYIFCVFAPSSVAALESDERRELRVASFLFIFGSVGIIVMLSLALNAHPAFALVYYVLALLLTIGLIRAVAEGGLLGFQAWANPFHFIRTFFGMDRLWTAPALFSPLLLYHAVFFNDIKAFIAPAMANALKIRDDLKLRRVHFHAAIAAAIIIAVAVGVGTEIMMGYSKGADNMERWFHSMAPKSLFDLIASLSKTPPTAAPAEAGWAVAGAVAMAALLYFRQTLFWLPHPIGLIMLVNPIMRAYWFSILIGWLAKFLVTRYGNKDAYGRVKGLFIGLIAGEIVLVIIATVVSLIIGFRIPIDLDRN